MNYYERYCGDYARDTAHLSLAEHGAYTLLLDAYYSTERGLPEPYGPLYRLCRAMNKAEQGSVRVVADEYFPVGEDGLRHNARADRDLAKALPRIATARANGATGGRPRNNPAGFENETQRKPSGLLNDNPTETQPGEAFHHTPHTTLIPPQRKKRGGITPASPLPDDFGISDRVKAWATDRGHARIGERLEHFVGYAKRSGKRYVDWDEAFMAAIREDWAHLNDKPPAGPAPSKRQVAL